MSQKPTSSTRSRYANPAMTNVDDRTTTQSQRPLGTTAFPQSTSWGSSIWGNNSGTVLTNTENLGSRSSPKEMAPSGPLAPTTDSESWKTTWGADTSQTRNTSGSTSPNRTRDSVGRNLPSTSPYITTAQMQTQPAIGQRAPNGTSRWNTNPAYDSSPRTINQLTHPGSYPDHNSEEQTGPALGQSAAYELDSSGRGFRGEARTFQETFTGVGASTFARDNTLGLGTHHNVDTQSQARHYSDVGYDSRAASAGHSQRGSISGSFGSSTVNMRTSTNPPNDLDNYEHRFGAISLNDGPVAAASVAGSFPTFNNTTGRPFQFNPGSQSWEHFGAQGTANDSRFQSIQGGPPDCGFSVSSAYGRQSRGSPRTSGGTPQPLRDPVFRPASRDQRSVPEPNHRGRGHQVTPPQVAQLYAQHYYDPSFGASPQLYGPSYNPNVNVRFPQGLQYPTPYMSVNYNTVSNRPSRDQDSAEAQRSQLLRDFRIAHKTNRRYELRDIYDHVVEFCGDQHGSRFIQDKLTTANSDEKDQIFREIEPNAVPLMMDVFGNYVVQKLFEHGSQIQKKLLAKAMKGRMVNLSLDQYGCRVVQKALEYVLREQQQELVKELEPDVLKVMKDTNGNHVIQKALQFVPEQYLGFIFSSFRGRVKELACHTCACRVIQKIIDFSSESEKASIVEEVHAHTRELTNDQYGNYVIQHLLKKGKPEDRTRIIKSVQGDIVHLSKQKYASNVVEKCAQYGTPEEVLQIEAEMTTPGPDGTVPLQSMIVDQFANYVVQKHMEHTPNKQAYMEALRPQLQWARNSNYSGKHVERIAELLREMSPAPVVQATPSTRHSSMAPTSPLQLDVGSAAPTPNLTMEPNSPSSSPPSTAESAVDEPVGVTLKSQMASADGLSRGPEVRVED